MSRLELLGSRLRCVSLISCLEWWLELWLWSTLTICPRQCSTYTYQLQKLKNSQTNHHNTSEYSKWSSLWPVLLQRTASEHDVEDAVLPRSRKVPTNFEVGTSSPVYPDSPKDRYKHIYFEALDMLLFACMTDSTSQGILCVWLLNLSYFKKPMAMIIRQKWKRPRIPWFLFGCLSLGWPATDIVTALQE